MVKITYVTITYNAGETLPFTVNSVLCQDYRHIEHIIVDGASKDNTVKIAEEYKKKSDAAGNGHDVIIVSERDNGIYDAMNKGLAMATGDYVCFLNAGDALPNSSVVRQMIPNLEPLPAVLYGDTDIVDNERHNLGKRRLSPPETLTWRSFRHGMLVCHQSFYALTSIAQQFKYDLSYRHSADFDWCIRVMKYAEEHRLALYNTRMTLANYLKEGDTTRHHKESLMERYNIMCGYYGKLSTLFMHIWFVVRNLTK